MADGERQAVVRRVAGVTRTAISRSQLCELLAIDPAGFIAIEPDPCSRNGGQRDPECWWIVQEGEMTQTTGAFPQLTKGGKKIGGKKAGGKRGC